MTNPEFEALVSRLEIYAARSPRMYRLRVALLAWLGYAALSLVLLVLAVIIGGIAAIVALPQHPVLLLKLLIGPVALAATFLRSLKVSFPEPEGLKITRNDTPALFVMLDELQSRLNAPRFHCVLLTREMNAAVAQIPRLGIFGWQRNFLMLGLPLLQTLSPEQFRAVAAHEVGHLSGNHGRFGGWIHRVRLIWSQVLENLRQDKQRKASAWFGRFIEWYAPYFSAYTFVLARQNEYEADECSAEIAGASVMAQALIAVQVHSRFWEERFWPQIQKHAEQEPVPPPVFATLTSVFQTQLVADDARLFVSNALCQKTSTADTHPSLSDRLRGLRFQPDAAQMPLETSPGACTAAAFYLGLAEAPLTDQLEKEWQQQVTSRWNQRYQQTQESRSALAALREKALLQALTEEEQWHQACLTAEYGDPETGITLLQQIVSATPLNPDAQMALGQLLLKSGNAAGLQHLKTAIELQPDLILSASQIAFQFCKRHGREKEAEAFGLQAAARRNLLIEAQRERESIGDKAQFEAHGLPPEALSDLAGQLRGFRDVQSAYLVRKKMKCLPEHPLYVLWIAPPLVRQSSRADIVKKLAPQIQFQFPGQMRIRVVEGSDLRLIKLRRTVKSAQFYRKGH